MGKILLLTLAAVFLAGCVSTATPRSAECLDARRSIQLIEVESPTSVIVRQDPSRHYRVHLQECLALTPRSHVSAANGMPKQIHRGHLPPIWASQIVGSGRICGGGFDQLVVRKPGDDMTFPPVSCRITQVHKVPSP